MDREAELVELVDEEGRSVGSATVADAHSRPGLLHRAFSVQLLDPDGRLLLQRRAPTKTRFPLRWANACCGHPRPGEAITEAGARRLAEELGLTGVTLTEVAVHRYRATDPVTNRVEHEYDHVLLGRVGSAPELAPDPAEVAELRWARVDELLAAAVAGPDAYAPWLVGVTRPLASST